MDVRQIQEIVTGSAAIAAGAMLVFMDPSQLPGVFGSLSSRLGRARRTVGVVVIACGVVAIKPWGF